MPIAERYCVDDGAVLVMSPCSFWSITMRTLGLMPQDRPTRAMISAEDMVAAGRPAQYASAAKALVAWE